MVPKFRAKRTKEAKVTKVETSSLFASSAPFANFARNRIIIADERKSLDDRNKMTEWNGNHE